MTTAIIEYVQVEAALAELAKQYKGVLFNVEAEAAKAKKIRDVEEARLKAERDKLDLELRAAEEKARKERESVAVEQREKMRQINELKDGREMLKAFVHVFGHRSEFLSIAKAIKEYLK